MNSSPWQDIERVPTWFVGSIIVLLTFGVAVRLTHLGDKPFWQDEVYTLLRVAGYSVAEIRPQILDGHEMGTEDLLRYQRQDADRNVIDTVIALVRDNPQHPPLYFTLAHFWVRLFGSSATAIRGLSALISLLAFPCAFWLCRELFNSRRTAWVAVGLLAVSPFHLLYAQEARPYSLLTVAVLLSTAVLLRAIRIETKRAWWAYGAIIAFGCYTHLFFFFVVAAHGIYMALCGRSEISFVPLRLPKSLKGYMFAMLLAMTAFAPWALAIILRHEAVQSSSGWLNAELSYRTLMTRWVAGFSILFLDVQGSLFHDINHGVARFEIAASRLPFLVFVGYSIYFLCRTTPARVWLLVLTLAAVTSLALTLPDLIFGGQRSTIPRYWIPCYVAVQLSTAHLLAVGFFSGRALQRWVWRGVGGLLAGAGVVSCVLIWQADAWWSKPGGQKMQEVARLVNRAERPLLVSDGSAGTNLGNMLSLGYQLDPKVRVCMVNHKNVRPIPDEFSDIFIFNPSDRTREALEAQFNCGTERVAPSKKLWRVMR